MKVAIIGKGGREHAIAAHLNANGHQIYTQSGNPSIDKLPNRQSRALLDDNKHRKDNLAFLQQEGVDLIIPGPEIAIANGIADDCETAGIACFAPSAAAGRLETSKQFAKDFMRKYNIPTADYGNFHSAQQALDYLHQQPERSLVIKADALAAGKGVVVAADIKQAKAAVEALAAGEIAGNVGQNFVIEEFMAGKEVSYTVMVNGTDYLVMQPCRDHKQAYDNDLGPNTGGMGAFSPVPDFTAAMEQVVINDILVPTLQGMVQEGHPYKGFLYIGLMLCTDGSIKVVEYNVRLGDPEAQLLLTRLQSDALQHCLQLLNNNITTPMQWDDQATVGVTLASGGYPSATMDLNHQINGLDTIADGYFTAGAKLNDTGQLINSGGRILLVMGSGKTLRQASEQAYDRIAKIDCKNSFYRKDIANKT